MTAPEREALDTGLDSMARQIESALDYDVAKRRQEGLETTPDTHLMSPPSWPSHGCLRHWIKALDEARKLLSAAPAVTVTEGDIDANIRLLAGEIVFELPSEAGGGAVRRDFIFRKLRNARDIFQAAASPRKSEREWRDGSTAPEDGTEIIVGVTYRYALYKPDGARQMKKPGRWQRMGEFGWENCEKPERWTALKSTTPQTGSQE